MSEMEKKLINQIILLCAASDQNNYIYELENKEKIYLKDNNNNLTEKKKKYELPCGESNPGHGGESAGS